MSPIEPWDWPATQLVWNKYKQDYEQVPEITLENFMFLTDRLNELILELEQSKDG